VVKRLKSRDPNLVYLLDHVLSLLIEPIPLADAPPAVLGDAGKLYMSTDIISIYKELLLYSTIITPDWFEVEFVQSAFLNPTLSLTAIQDSHRNNFRLYWIPQEALGVLHDDYGVPHVVVSSIPFNATCSELWALPPDLGEKLFDKALVLQSTGASLLCISSSKPHSRCGKPVVHAAAVLQLAGYYLGVGDLFSVMVLAHFELSSPTNLPSSPTPCLQTASTALWITHTILCCMVLYASHWPNAKMDNYTDDKLGSMDKGRVARHMKVRKLRLIQSVDLILSDTGAAESVPIPTTVVVPKAVDKGKTVVKKFDWEILRKTLHSSIGPCLSTVMSVYLCLYSC